MTKFRVALKEDSIDERVYVDENSYNSLSDEERYNTNSPTILKSYFTKEKIEQLKREFCDRIMSEENPFDIYECDSDCYEMEDSEIEKIKTKLIKD